jgi:1-deoxy-D-xylulose-5-phosphate reductoisomerase
MAEATCAQALAHPNWNMGAKITIDSATMMNKGLEVIEAKWLFDVSADDINVVVHPQSVIHSMVEFEDGAVLAQMGCPDMRQPIQYALAYPSRLDLSNEKLDFAALGSLTFEKPDMERFPCLALAFDAIRTGGNMPCIANAANEEAVAAFLAGKIAFYDIPAVIEKCMGQVSFLQSPSLDDIYTTNEQTRALAASMIEKW